MNKPVHPPTLTGQILMFLVLQKGTWATYGTGYYMPSVQSVFPVGTSKELQFRFMRRLQSLGLVGGCDCGCRGDYAPLEAGLEYLEDSSLQGLNEVHNWRQGRYSLGY